MNAVYLDHSSTESKNNIIMYILLFVDRIIYKINLDSNIRIFAYYIDST